MHVNKMSVGSGTTTVFLRDPNHSRSYVNFIRGIGEAKTKHVRRTHAVHVGRRGWSAAGGAAIVAVLKRCRSSAALHVTPQSRRLPLATSE